MAAASEAQAIFKQIDTNGDGALDMTELSTKLSDFGMSEEKIMSLFVAMDKDGNGVVDATEWEQGYAEYQAMLRMPSLQLEILEAIAAARADPAQCAAAIRERKKRYSGNQYQAPPGLHDHTVLLYFCCLGGHLFVCLAWMHCTFLRFTLCLLSPLSGKDGGAAPPVKMTKEGVAAADDALAFLKDKPGLPGFDIAQHPGLRLAGEDHIVDVGHVGVASHVGSDGSGCWDRMDRYGDWHEGACGEPPKSS